MILQTIALTLICIGNLGAAILLPTTFELRKHTEQPNPAASQAYKDWIVSQNPSPGKQALLTLTLTSTDFPLSPTITWYKAHISGNELKQLLEDAYLSSSLEIRTTQSAYNYKSNDAFWIDFANADCFGGGFRSKGIAQEESLFYEFPILANLAYAVRESKEILPVTNSGSAEPFLVVSALRRFDVSKVPYEKSSPKGMKQAVIRLKKPFVSANIIGLAAIDFSRKSRSKYTMNHLEYLLQAALLGDLAALHYNNSNQTGVIIHTGKWGVGAFKNSVKMATAIQILAAEMAFTGNTKASRLIFHGIDKEIVATIHQEILQELLRGASPSSILDILLDHQNRDASWRPQNSN